ncbi:hypothetical protein [Helicobacter sp. T3_23-1056]
MFVVKHARFYPPQNLKNQTPQNLKSQIKSSASTFYFKPKKN